MAVNIPKIDRIQFHRLFEKDWDKISSDKIRNKFIDVILPAFIKNPFDNAFRNHNVSPKFPNGRSIDITGDIRAIYYPLNGFFIFIRIGTHSHIYG
jgi:mRNA-degrading endonuclease YafQ of YafQ-DinJ toxin-antitoxin module